MNLIMMKSKIHNATVTGAILDYEGSISIDTDILVKANILVNERVQVVNLNNGERLETYVIKGKKGSNEICLNGPAARTAYPGDKIIIISYAAMTEEEAKAYKQIVVILDDKNNIKEIKK